MDDNKNNITSQSATSQPIPPAPTVPPPTPVSTELNESLPSTLPTTPIDTHTTLPKPTPENGHTDVGEICQNAHTPEQSSVTQSILPNFLVSAETNSQHDISSIKHSTEQSFTNSKKPSLQPQAQSLQSPAELQQELSLRSSPAPQITSSTTAENAKKTKTRVDITDPQPQPSSSSSTTSMSRLSPKTCLFQLSTANTTKATEQPSTFSGNIPSGVRQTPAGIKQEPPDDMKDYVQTTMNELLGWYGLSSLDNMDTGSLQAMTSLAYRTAHKNSSTSSASGPMSTSKKQIINETVTIHDGCLVNDIANEFSKEDNMNKDKIKINCEMKGSSRYYNQAGISGGVVIKATDEHTENSVNSNCLSSSLQDMTSGLRKYKSSSDSNNNNKDDKDHTSEYIKSHNMDATSSKIPVEGETTPRTRDANDQNSRCSSNNSSRSYSSSCESTMVIGPIPNLNGDNSKFKNNNSNNCYDNNDNDDDNSGADVANSGNEVLHERDSTSRDSDSTMTSNAVPVPESDKSTEVVCSWCQLKGSKLLTLETPTGVKVFCSDLCFTQSRRASFKKNKVCDWCKHVRHTVNFVDFQDGDTQLQFCSEKCLNQYKMNIFCKEAQEHLQHFQDMDEGVVTTADSEDKGQDRVSGRVQKKEILITPELWLTVNDTRGQDGESGDVVKREVDDNDDHGDVDDTSGQCDDVDDFRQRRVTLFNDCMEGYNDDDDDDDDEDFDDADVNDVNDDDDDYDDEDVIEHDDDDNEFENKEMAEIGEIMKPHRFNLLEQANAAPAVSRNAVRESASSQNSEKSKILGKSTITNRKNKTFKDKSRRSMSGNRENRHEINDFKLGDNASISSTHGNGNSSQIHRDSNDETLVAKATDPLFHHWAAASRLLARMPPQPMRDADSTPETTTMGVGGLAPHLNPLANPAAAVASSLLYSNLFRLSTLPQSSISATQAEEATARSPSSTTNAPMSSTSQNSDGDSYKQKLRREARRELLRDRNLSREGSGHRKTNSSLSALFHDRENRESSAVPLSPSTSHSSAGTPSPPQPLPDHHNVLPPPLSAFAQNLRFPHSLLMPNGVQGENLVPELFSDPAHASSLFQLQLALQQNAARQINPLDPSSVINIPHRQLPHPVPPIPYPYSSTKDNKRTDPNQTLTQPNTCNTNTPQVNPPLNNTPSSSNQQPSTPSTTHHHHHHQQPTIQSLNPHGLPPVTVLVPYPIAIPIPLPLPFPFPIPISPEKFTDFLAKHSELNAPPTPSTSSEYQSQRKVNDTNSTRPNNPLRDSVYSSTTSGSHPNPPLIRKRSPSSSPSLFTTPSPFTNTLTPNLDLPGGSSTRHSDNLTTIESSTNLMTSLIRETLRQAERSPGSSSASIKRPLSESFNPYTLDLTKKPRHSFSSSSTSNEDEAIDLSSKQSFSNSLSPKLTDISSEKENNFLTTRISTPSSATVGTSSRNSLDSSPDHLTVPKIHLVSDNWTPLPLCTSPPTSQLPPPVEQSSYSRRRSRILDAPSVPRETRMASPERRYVRNVPKDMVDAAKRRGLRARVKTK